MHAVISSSRARQVRSVLAISIFLATAPYPAFAQTSAEIAQQLSQLKAIQSRDLLAKGDRKAAITTALQGLPKNFTSEDIKARPEAYEALYWAVRSRSLRLPVAGSVHTSFNWQGTRVATVSAEVGAGARKEGLKLWDAMSGTLIAELLPRERSGTSGATLGPLSFSRDGRLAMHVDPGRQQPIIWNADTGAVLHELPKVPGSGAMVTVPKMQLSATGRFALAAGAGGVRLYDVGGNKALWTKPGSMAVSISPDETRVATAVATRSSGGGEFQTIRIELSDVASGSKVWSKDVAEPSWGAYSAIFSDDGRLIGVTTSSNALIVVDTTTDSVQRISIPRVGTSGLSFSPDAKYIAVVSEDWSSTQPAFYDLATGRKVTLPLEQKAALDSVFAMSGEEVGAPWFPDAGDIWRKVPMGADLYAAANAALEGREVKAPEEPERTTSSGATAPRGWLGVKIANAEKGGVSVTGVTDGGPADDKLKEGDVLVEIDRTKIVSSIELARYITSRAPGDAVMLKILRGGRTVHEAVELGKFPTE